MRDGSWTGAILGRLNLVVRASQMVKLVLSFSTRRRLLLLMTTRPIHSARCASHGDERATNCQTYDIPFAIEPSYRQVKRAAVAAVADTSPALIYRHSPSSGG